MHDMKPHNDINSSLGWPAGLSAQELAVRFPWFVTAGMAEQKQGRTPDPLTALYLTAHPYPSPLLSAEAPDRHSAEEVTPPEAQALETDSPGTDDRDEEVIDLSATGAAFAEVPDGEAELSLDSLIDKFLETGEHRITPAEDTPEYDAAAESNVLELTDEIATRQLAEIYEQQGLKKEAEEIRRKLEEAGKAE